MEAKSLTSDESNKTWNILVIDDDEEDFFLAKGMLREARWRKYTVQWASSYQAGVQELAQNHYDAVLVDYDLGLHSGIELIRQASEQGYPAPLILFTGRGNYEVDMEAMQAGATLYLTKNEANPLLLERGIRYAIELKHREQALIAREADLLRSEEKFARAFQYNPAAMTITRISDGKYTDANERFCEMVGYSREEIVGRSPVELGFFSGEMRTAVLRQFHEQGYVHQQEFPVLTRDGSQRYVLFSLDPIEVGGEKTDSEPSILATMIDITGRKQAEALLNERSEVLRQREDDLRKTTDGLLESEERLREFLESTHDNFLALDREWRVTYANRHFGEVMQVDPRDLIGKNYLELFPQYTGTIVEQNFRKVMEERVPVHFRQAGVYTHSLYEVSVYPTREGLAIFSTDRSEEQRKQQEILQRDDQLRASEEQLKAVIDNLPQGLIVVNGAGETLRWNRTALEMHGYRQQTDELTFMKYIEELYQIHSLDGEQLPLEQWPVPRILRGETFEDYELLVSRPVDHWQQVFSYSGVPVIADGQMTMGLLSIRDVTREKQLEGDLRFALKKAEEGQRMLEALMEYVPEGITIADAQDVTIYMVSRFGQDLLGRSHAQMTAEQVADEWKVYDQDGVTPLPPEELPIVRAIRKGEVVKNQDLVQVNSRGERLFLSCSAGPIRDASGAITGGVVAWRDITERKQAEQALVESEKRLRKLMEGNIIGINVRDAAGRLQDANLSFLNMVGYCCADLENGNLNIRDLTPPAYWNADQEAINEALATGSCRPYEKEYLHKDGHSIPAMVGYTRLDENDESFIGYVLDLTELKKTQAALQDYAEKLKSSNQDLEQFAFVASHDLQEPLRKVKLFSDAIQRRLADTLEADTLDYFQRMINAVDRMQRMVQDLLQLSRVNTQARPFEQVDLSRVAAEVVSDLEMQINRTGGRVMVEALPVLQADAMQMHQVFQNLIANALKFHSADRPPLVRVSGELLPGNNDTETKVLIRVEDNGIGFEQDQFEQILQPFHRLHNRAEYEGTGIGLAIVKKIIDRHQGQISARSTPGQGSTFFITLPVKHSGT